MEADTSNVAFPFVEVKTEVEEYQEECDNTQNDQIFHNIKVEQNEEEFDNIEQNQLDPFDIVNVKLEAFGEDFITEESNNDTINTISYHHFKDLISNNL